MHWMLLALAWTSPVQAQVAGYPSLDNETIGLVRALGQAVEGAPEEFDEAQWSPTLIEAVDSGDAMTPTRYLIAFSAYAVAASARHTPAWRAPQAAIYEGYLQKMAQPVAWEDYLLIWGGDSPLGPGNIMYTGHLAYMMGLQQHLFGVQDPQLQLTATDGQSWTTSYTSLMQSLAEQAAASQDSTGAPIFNIACEPGQVFVPCNTPHRVAELLDPDIQADSLPAWLAWVEQEMVDEDHQVLHDLYQPHGDGVDTTPRRPDSLSGIYNAWTLWFMLGLDPDWAQALYPHYVETFVVDAQDSPSGRTMVVDRLDSTSEWASLMDGIATGFGMVAARSFGDDPLADQLLDTWNALHGPASWDETAQVWTHTALVLPRTYQNSFHLLMLSSGTQDPLGLEDAPWDPELPHLAAISDPGVFVNQAVWDADSAQLILTLNGGGAVDGSVDLSITSLSGETDWEVLRDGEPYDSASADGELLVITTPPLGARPETYVVQASAQGCGCGTGRGGGWLLGLLALPLWLRRRLP